MTDARRNEVQKATVDAGIRAATHAHVVRVLEVAHGLEDAHSVSDTIWARDAGLPKAYQRQAWRVARSRHTWAVGPYPVRAEDGYVYLAPMVRVRNGRGTSLVVETLTSDFKWRARHGAATALTSEQAVIEDAWIARGGAARWELDGVGLGGLKRHGLMERLVRR